MESQLIDVQGDFKDERKRVDQVFALKAVCKKYLKMNKWVTFMDLKKRMIKLIK